MSIINKGIFNSGSAYLRQLGNDWPTAQVVTTADIIESSSNLYFSNVRVVQVVAPLLTTSNVVERTNQYFTNVRVLQAVVPLLTSANVIESSSNLYFTNTRAIEALTIGTVQGDISVSGNLIANGLIIRNISVSDSVLVGSTSANSIVAESVTANIWYRLYTSNVVETTNQYFTNVRTLQAVVPLLTTANVVETTNQYFTNVRARNALTIGTVPGDIAVSGNLIANGLIIRNISVSDSVLSGNITAGGVIGDTIVADSITANTWGRLYTANVVETAGNLYFTQTRARSSFSAGNNITIDPDGTISAQTQAVVANDSEAIVALANTLTYVISRNVTDPTSILVINEGLIQIPIFDYDTAASTITFTSALPANSLIEIRYFGIDSAASFSTTFLATVNTFVGNGVDTIFGLSTTPGGEAYTTVIIDGVAQQTASYSLSGSSIIFSEPPADGADIDVRVYAGSAGGSFNTRTYIGNGSNVSYPITSGFHAQNILVFENGVAQVPDADYTVSAESILTFTTPPAANIVVQIRELGSGVANLVNQIAGIDIRTGNLAPLFNNIQTIGTANLKYSKIYLADTDSLVIGNTTIGVSGTSLTLTTQGVTSKVSTEFNPISFMLGGM